MRPSPPKPISVQQSARTAAPKTSRPAAKRTVAKTLATTSSMPSMSRLASLKINLEK
jgi:vacuolar-type H+-ATPase catalytic subunit A/Vma1